MTALASKKLCHHYSLADIRLATQNFNNRLVVGQGAFGKVYRGHIKSETSSSNIVAIKRLNSMSDQGAPEFKTEVEMLSRLRHSHLVSLLGYCVDGKEMILVYEYMPRGTLHHHLHKSTTPLTWMQRLRISIGAARGLHYLHTGSGTKHGIVHRDVKSANILLDEDWAVKIADFGLAKICPINQSSTYVNTRVKGTFGYLDPEFSMTGKLTRRTDVYAFGVVLFELLSRRHAVLPDDDDDLCLARWAQTCIKKGNLDQLVAAEIRGKLSPKSLKEFAQIAYRCLHSDPKVRPTMSQVVVALEMSLASQEKFDSCAKPYKFAWKMPKFFAPSSVNQEVKIFSYTDLKCATRNFQNPTIGSIWGVWITKGWVHKRTHAPSMLDVGLAISVTKLGNSVYWDLELLGKFSHPNLVKLLGYCLEDKSLYLVHEFMEKRSLQDYLCKGAAVELPLLKRTKIAVGVARGLVFLLSHQMITRKKVLETSDIWFDKDFNTKLLDFDVSELIGRSDRVGRLNHGPNAASSVCQQLRQCDVNGLGMLLIEILTGRPFHDKPIMDFVKKDCLCRDVAEMSNEMIKNVVDSRIKINAPQIEIARELLFLIQKCARDNYTIKEALKDLEQIYSRTQL